MTKIAHSLDAVIAALEAVIEGRPIPTEAIAPAQEAPPPTPAPVPADPHPQVADLERRVKDLADYVAGFVVPMPVESIGEAALRDVHARMAEFEQRISDLFKQGSVVPVVDHTDRLHKIEQGLDGFLSLAHTMMAEMNQKFAEVHAKLAAAEAWLLVVEAQSDPVPTLANHAAAGRVLGMTAAQDGNAEAWAQAIKAFKEAGR